MRIRSVWRSRSQPERIHYIVERSDGWQRHLWEPEHTAWGQVLAMMFA